MHIPGTDDQGSVTKRQCPIHGAQLQSNSLYLFSLYFQVTCGSSDIWKEDHVTLHPLTKINHKKNHARPVTAACSLCDYTCVQVEAEDEAGHRTVKELCEKAEYHCIYVVSFSTENFKLPWPLSKKLDINLGYSYLQGTETTRY